MVHLFLKTEGLWFADKVKWRLAGEPFRESENCCDSSEAATGDSLVTQVPGFERKKKRVAKRRQVEPPQHVRPHLPPLRGSRVCYDSVFLGLASQAIAFRHFVTKTM
jgi:hypothetical protein